MKKVRFVVVGAGARGNAYAQYAKDYPDKLEIVGVADPREFYRNDMAEKYGIRKENVFADWQDMAKKERFADAVIIATPDKLHAAPALAFAEKKYHMLLEKPMATNEEDCRKIVASVKRNGIIFAVCHVMRYTRYTATLKNLLDSHIIGDIVSMQHIEEVGWWHQAHSYVRGNWRNEEESSSMLLAKSCHDLDWLRYLIGKKCVAVSSFGSLKHFRKEEKPPRAASRCLDCAVETECPYSAKKIYLGRFHKGHRVWPLNVLTPVVTEESLVEALKVGPYGRCVYECDNDVVDNQVVNMSFEGGETAVFTMTAFAKGGRKIRIFGTRGEISGDGSVLKIFDFLTEETKTIDTNASDGSILGGHGGGDYGVMESFVKAVGENNPGLIISGTDETLESHLMVFGAEKSRRQNIIVKL